MNITGKIKQVIRKVKYGVRSNSENYIAYLRNLGMSIGERTVIFDPRFTLIDETRPWAVEIGSDVQITHGVTILTHGYDWSVLKGKYGTVLGSYGSVKIGNNVFVGMNTTILKGVKIGDNVIIGAGSLVNKDIPSNCVAVGNPCHEIMGIEEYLKKRSCVQESEARALVKDYRNRFGRDPGSCDLHEFFFLFSDGESVLTERYKHMMELVGTGELSYKLLRENQPPYSDFEDFLRNVDNEV